jgi:hypothetical protein
VNFFLLSYYVFQEKEVRDSTASLVKANFWKKAVCFSVRSGEMAEAETNMVSHFWELDSEQAS